MPTSRIFHNGIGVGGPSDRRRPRRRLTAPVTAFVLALAAALLAGAQPARAASAPQMHFDRRMTTTTVCFPVTNPAGGQSTLYGLRYIDGPVTALTPAIVLAIPGTGPAGFRELSRARSAVSPTRCSPIGSRS